MHVSVLTARKRILGADHELTLLTTYGMASCIVCQGRFDEAGQILACLVPQCERVLGSEHPDTQNAVNLRDIVGSSVRFIDLDELEPVAPPANRRVRRKPRKPASAVVMTEAERHEAEVRSVVAEAELMAMLELEDAQNAAAGPSDSKGKGKKKPKKGGK